MTHRATLLDLTTTVDSSFSLSSNSYFFFQFLLLWIILERGFRFEKIEALLNGCKEGTRISAFQEGCEAVGLVERWCSSGTRLRMS